MKKTVMIILSVVLAAGMIFGLSGCSFRFLTDGKSRDTHSFDLGDIIDTDQISSSLEQIGLDELAQAVESVDTDEIGSKLEEAGQAVSEFFGGLLEAAGEIFISSLGDSSGKPSAVPEPDDTESFKGIGSDNISAFEPERVPDYPDFPDLDQLINGSESISGAISGDNDDAMEIVKDVLESLGMEEYFESIMEDLNNNPELFEEYAQAFADSSDGQSSGSEAAQDEAFGGLHSVQE